MFPLILGGVSCQMTPDTNEFINAYTHLESQMSHEVAILDAQRKAGALTAQEYDYKMGVLKRTLTARANDRVLTEHQLRESYNAALGMPKPGSEHQQVNFPSGPVGGVDMPSRPGFENF